MSGCIAIGGTCGQPCVTTWAYCNQHLQLDQVVAECKRLRGLIRDAQAAAGADRNDCPWCDSKLYEFIRGDGNVEGGYLTMKHYSNCPAFHPDGTVRCAMSETKLASWREMLPIAQRIMSACPSGCCWHILLSDGNTSPRDAKFCADYAAKSQATTCDTKGACLELAPLALRASETQLVRLYEAV